LIRTDDPASFTGSGVAAALLEDPVLRPLPRISITPPGTITSSESLTTGVELRGAPSPCNSPVTQSSAFNIIVWNRLSSQVSSKWPSAV
jgi:hypothetical protein